MTTNYRGKIEEILSRHARAGEDLNESVLAGSPDVIDAEEAIAISEWIRNRANQKWGYDPRHRQISVEILHIIAGELTMPDKTNQARRMSVRLEPDIHAIVSEISIRDRRAIQTVVDMLLRKALEKLPKTKR